MAHLLFGTSGWSYREWIGPFYRKSARKFTYYTKFFRSVEINSTFYRYPTRSQIFGYLRSSPRDFVFSAKLPKVLTHEKFLSSGLGVKENLTRFLDLLDPLRRVGKLGAILIQLPPSFTYERNMEDLKRFFEVLPEEYEFAVEFRDPSWLRNDVWRLLSRYDVAYTIVDEPLLPPIIKATSDFAYIRWHGRGTRPWYNYHYSLKELEEWVPRVREVEEKVEKIYGYFNNHYHGYAPENCVEILEMLDLAVPKQIEIKENIIRYNLQQRPLAYERRLEDFGLSLTEQDVRNLLLKLSDKARIGRALRMGEEEIRVEKSGEDHVMARVRNYKIDIDLEAKRIYHDCDDWRKGLGIGRLCKHLCKLFLFLPKERSTKILEDIIDEKEKWQFKHVP